MKKQLYDFCIEGTSRKGNVKGTFRLHTNAETSDKAKEEIQKDLEKIEHKNVVITKVEVYLLISDAGL